MATQNAIIPAEIVEQRILMIRGHKVMLDRDLAELYGVATKVLNQGIKRHGERFPADFMFQLTKQEKDEVVTICDHLLPMKYSPTLPYAFTEHGVIMAANVLNSKRAVAVSIKIVRAFAHLRQMLTSHAELSRRMDALEEEYEAQFKVVFDAIKELMTPVDEDKKQIGFKVKKSLAA